ncbi:hypothetical protein GJ689_19495 [Rhodoplanes serenus]|uniref:Rap1a immunity protein domain-containing protein n=1 Tax=Rhodoplanes serenus TaxID=200615 RepID=A0A9X5ATI0_9BRAD|nr:HdeA/HdeB family chaperone [Rhodoplanes serenus]MTW18391.1 hypothetical protein [Rhodoplanes serenus]
MLTVGRHRTRCAIVAVGALAALTIVEAFAQDQKPGERSITSFACKDILRESGADRDVAIAFLHGYLLGKSGRSSFDTEALRTETIAFIDRCLDNPSETAERAMLTVKAK